MAGSRKWFRYQTDAGATYAINLDESNTEAVMLGAVDDFDYNDTSVVNDAVPRNIKPRKVFYANAARTRTIGCTVPTQAQYADIVSGTAAPTITDPVEGTGDLVLIRAQGESISIPFAADTGLTDGDAT